MPKMVMTVDDSASFRQMVRFILKQAGYDVIEAVDGQDAADKIAETNVHMIITDLNMPKMDGIELIKHIRNDLKDRFVPIIMLTTESQDSRKQEGRKAGATGWIVKPFKPEQLIMVVKKLIKT